MVALVVPAMPIVAVIVIERRWDLLRALVHPRGWWLFAALVIPWHLVIAWRHTGFFWDYVVNQHLLFFLDRKEPRDSVGIALPLFWLAVVLRLFPWTWMVPPAMAFSVQRLWNEPERRTAFLIPIIWATAALGFFSLTAARLEHYALPALPALAMLIAALLRYAPEYGPRWRAGVRGLYLLTTITLLGVALLLPDFLANDAWLKGAPDIVNIPGPYFAIMAAAWLAATPLTVRAPTFAVLIACAACLIGTPFVRRGFIAFAPINSSAPVAAAISTVATSETRVVFEAPTEYQLVAGLNFYLRRPVTLLRPAAFVEPTYLMPYRHALFIDRNHLIELWRRVDLIFVTNPLAAADRPLTDAVPAPFTVVARIGDRWIVRNQR
jgi:4-amino-4-deoxy-L-arabinose transferase-like glycosyltransferase